MKLLRHTGAIASAAFLASLGAAPAWADSYSSSEFLPAQVVVWSGSHVVSGPDAVPDGIHYIAPFGTTSTGVLNPYTARVGSLYL